MTGNYCALCGVDLKDGNTAYGLTRGVINEELYGFCIDDESEWDMYCSACMNQIDVLLADFRKGRM